MNLLALRKRRFDRRCQSAESRRNIRPDMNPQGASALYGRIVQAAYAVCDTADIGLWSRTAVHDCISKAVADAVTKVGRPQLIAVYNAKNSRPLPVTLATAQTR